MKEPLPHPPIAKRVLHAFTRHGITVEDPYAWLRDPGYPEVKDADILAYLNAENAYFESVMKPHRPLVERIVEEMKGRIKDDDSSVPQKDGDYLYWYAFQQGGEYAMWYRRKFAGGADEIILDEPAQFWRRAYANYAPVKPTEFHKLRTPA